MIKSTSFSSDALIQQMIPFDHVEAFGVNLPANEVILCLVQAILKLN